jgi:AcrR family transcriptional regulator
MGLREEKKARTRAALADTARSLILARGYDEITVTEITDTVGVSRRTFFRYFPTKEAAFFANQEERLERFQHRLLEGSHPHESPFDHIRRVCMEMSEDYVRDRALVVEQYRVTIASQHLLAYDMRFDVAWEEAIVAALTRDKPHDALRREQARVQAGAIIGVVRASLRYWFQQDGAPDLQALGERAFAILTASRLALG